MNSPINSSKKKAILQIGIDTSKYLSQNLHLSAFRSLKDSQTQFNVKQNKLRNPKEILEHQYQNQLKQIENVKHQQSILKKYRRNYNYSKKVKKRSFSSDSQKLCFHKFGFQQSNFLKQVRRRSSSFFNTLSNQKLQRLIAKVPHMQTKQITQQQFKQQLLMSKSLSFYNKKQHSSRQSIQINNSQKQMLHSIVNKIQKQSVFFKKSDSPPLKNKQNIVEPYSQKQVKQFLEINQPSLYQIKKGSKDDIYVNCQLQKLEKKNQRKKKSKLKRICAISSNSNSNSEQLSDSDSGESLENRKQFDGNQKMKKTKVNKIIFESMLQKNRLISNKTLNKFINSSNPQQTELNKKQSNNQEKSEKKGNRQNKRESLSQIYNQGLCRKIWIQPRVNYQQTVNFRKKVQSFHSRIEEVYNRNSSKSLRSHNLSPVYGKLKNDFQ